MPIHQKFTTDTGDLEKAYDKLARENTKLLETQAKITRESRAASAAATRHIRSNETAQERYNRTKKELDNLVKANLLTQNQYNRAMRRARQELEDVEDAGKKAFNASIISAWNQGLELAGKAWELFTRYAKAAREEVKQVAQNLQEAVEGQKALWQVSEGREIYQQLSQTTRQAMAGEGMTRQQAQDMVFNLKSLGRVEAAPTIARAGRFMAPEVAGEFYTTLAAPVNWGEAMADPEKALSGLLAGAGASRYNTAETANWVLRAAPVLKNIGATPGEIMGVGAAISTATPNPEMLATYMLALEKGISDWKTDAIAAWQEVEVADDKGRRKLAEKAGLTIDELVAQTRERAERAEAATGLIGGFRAMRTDEEAYEAAKGTEQRFKRASLALEGAIDQAEKITADVEKAMQSNRLFAEKTQQLPEDITRITRGARARGLREVALEPLAAKQEELQTAMDIGAAVGQATGKPLAITKVEEDLLEAGATYIDVELATEKAREQFLGRLRTAKPELYEKAIGDVFPTEERFGGPAGLASRGVHRYWAVDVPRELTARQQAALDRLVDELSEALGKRATSELVASLDENRKATEGLRDELRRGAKPRRGDNARAQLDAQAEP